MAYTAWSVVFGEQPTAAKWNQLGENDAGFKSGVNFDNAIIKSNHIDYTSVDVYSTSEVDTGRKWTDGRAIYRKVLIGNITVAVGANAIAHGITGIVNLEVVNIEGNVRLSSTVRGASVNLFWHKEGTGGNWLNPTSMDATNVVIFGSFAWGASAYTIIVEYVK